MIIELTEAEYSEADESYYGYCISCGASKDSCEPDARKYKCDECNKNEVYGASELLMMGKLIIKGE